MTALCPGTSEGGMFADGCHHVMATDAQCSQKLSGGYGGLHEIEEAVL